MSKRFESQQEVDRFLEQPRLAILLYNGARPAPTGVPVWFEWDGRKVRMFADRKSPKVVHLTQDPNISVLVTNRVGEQEGWVAFDGKVNVTDFDSDEWTELIDRMAPRYWDMSNPAYAQVVEGWRSAPEALVSLELTPEVIRSGA